MDKIFEALASDILSLPTAVVVVLIFASLVFYFFKDSIATWFKKEIKQSQKIAKLKHHRFFNVCDSVEARITNMSFITDGDIDIPKTKMMHELITLKNEAMQKHIANLVNTRGIDDWGVYELQFEFKKALGELVKEYNEKALKSFVKKGISHSDADFLIQNYEDYRSMMVEAFIDSIDSVLMNSDYHTNFDKVNTLLEICCVAIAVIPRDVRSSFEAVNGRYIKYKHLFDE